MGRYSIDELYDKLSNCKAWLKESIDMYMLVFILCSLYMYLAAIKSGLYVVNASTTNAIFSNSDIVTYRNSFAHVESKVVLTNIIGQLICNRTPAMLWDMDEDVMSAWDRIIEWYTSNSVE